jgi:phosphate butyryltransferase
MKNMIAIAARESKKTLSVAYPADKTVISAVERARKAGLIDAIFVGDQDIIEKIADDIDCDITSYKVIDVKDPKEAALKAVSLISSGEADFLMKGSLDTSLVLKAVLNDEVGICAEKLLSHVSVMELPNHPKLLTVTDAAMNIAPDANQKKEIIQNAVDLVIKLGIEKPLVAVLAAIEKVNPKMQATVDADKLVKMFENGEIQNCIVGGPFALDNAISIKAANIKKVSHPVAGNADILLCPDIESGNILYKSLSFLAYAKSGSIITGAKAPVVLTSRADSEDVKFNSIALGVIAIDERN